MARLCYPNSAESTGVRKNVVPLKIQEPATQPSFTGVVGTRAVTANGVVPGSGAELDTVRLSAANAAGQVSAVGGHVPEALATVALENSVPSGLEVRHLQEIVHHPGSRLQRTTAVSGASTPPTLRNRAEPRCTEEVQSLTQQQLVMAGVQHLRSIFKRCRQY